VFGGVDEPAERHRRLVQDIWGTGLEQLVHEAFDPHDPAGLASTRLTVLDWGVWPSLASVGLEVAESATHPRMQPRGSSWSGAVCPTDQLDAVGSARLIPQESGVGARQGVM
jgi:hypothetical protein